MWADEIKLEFPALRVSIADGYVSLTSKNFSGSYDIKLSRIDTPEKALGWVFHLLEKDWFGPLEAEKFIDRVAKHFGWQIHNV